MAHKLVTDEMVKKAWAAHRDDMLNGPAEQNNETSMRAALEAVADDLIEAVAEELAVTCNRVKREWISDRGEWAVSVIRSLKSQGQ